MRSPFALITVPHRYHTIEYKNLYGRLFLLFMWSNSSKFWCRGAISISGLFCLMHTGYSCVPKCAGQLRVLRDVYKLHYTRYLFFFVGGWLLYYFFSLLINNLLIEVTFDFFALRYMDDWVFIVDKNNIQIHYHGS